MEHKWASLGVCLIVARGGSQPGAAGSAPTSSPRTCTPVFTVNLFLAEGTPIRQTQGRGAAEPSRRSTRADRPGRRGLHDVRRRRRAAVLALDRARAARRELRPGPGPHPRPHQTTESWPSGSSSELPPGIAVGTGPRSSSSRPARRSASRCRSALLGQDLATLRRLGEQIKGFMREFPGTDRHPRRLGPRDPPVRPARSTPTGPTSPGSPTRTWPGS